MNRDVSNSLGDQKEVLDLSDIRREHAILCVGSDLGVATMVTIDNAIYVRVV